MFFDRRGKFRGEKLCFRRFIYGSLYSVCGMDFIGYLVKSVEKYDFYSGKVKFVVFVNIVCSGVGVVVFDGKMYVVGG